MTASPEDRPQNADGLSQLEGGVLSLEDAAVIQELELYCEALQRGGNPDRESLLSRYPEIASELSGACYITASLRPSLLPVPNLIIMDCCKSLRTTVGTVGPKS